MKVGEALKGTYASLSTKKQQQAQTKYQACKVELNYKEQIKKLQGQLEAYKKELKDEQSYVKQLEVILRQHQSELDQRFEEICELKDQGRKDIENTNLPNKRMIIWKSIMGIFKGS